MGVFCQAHHHKHVSVPKPSCHGSCSPQYPYNMYYPGLSYQPMPVGYNPAVVRGVYNPYPMYPSAYPLVSQAQQQPIQRGLISFENLLQVNGKFKTDDTTPPAMVVSGTFEFDQNFGTDLLYGNNAHYKIYINSGSTDLTGKNVALKFASSCAATDGTMFAEVNAPWQINGFWVTGSSTGFNIDGMNSKTSMKGMFLQVTDNTGIIGCSEAALA